MNAATGTIRRLTLVMACIGLLALSTAQQAGAEVNKGSDPSSNGTNQVLACEAMGGKATVVSHRTVAGDLVVKVTCTGGMGGGWSCENWDDEMHCYSSGMPLPTFGELDPSIGTGDEPWEVVDDGGSGSPVGPQPAADSPTAPDPSPSVAAPDDDQKQDTNKSKSKGKKSKKGKKGGKGRKR